MKFLKHKTVSIYCWPTLAPHFKEKARFIKKSHKDLYDMTPHYFPYFLSPPSPHLSFYMIRWPPYHSLNTSSAFFTESLSPSYFLYQKFSSPGVLMANSLFQSCTNVTSIRFSPAALFKITTHTAVYSPPYVLFFFFHSMYHRIYCRNDWLIKALQ